MSIYLNTDEYFDNLHHVFDNIKPTKVLIASYGFFVGIMPDGRDLKSWHKFKSRARDFLEYIIDKTTVNILIGLYSYNSCCKEHICIDCEKKYVTDLVRHVLHAEKFTSCNWRLSDTSHIKCVIMENKDTPKISVVTGSRNFGDSQWTDVSMDLNNVKDIVRIRDFMIKEWNDAKEINNSSIEHFLTKNNISPSVMADF